MERFTFLKLFLLFLDLFFVCKLSLDALSLCELLKVTLSSDTDDLGQIALIEHFLDDVFAYLLFLASL